jgi:hypothetical protein
VGRPGRDCKKVKTCVKGSAESLPGEHPAIERGLGAARREGQRWYLVRAEPQEGKRVWRPRAGGFPHSWPTLRPASRLGLGLPAGMVSCMAFSPLGAAAGGGGGGHVLAAGSYAGSIGLYDSRTWELIFLLQGHKGGLTQLQFTADGSFLLSGARRDPHLLMWDLRCVCTQCQCSLSFRCPLKHHGSRLLDLDPLLSIPSLPPPFLPSFLRNGGASELYRLERDTGGTNQRIQFSVEPCGRHLATGGCGGCVRVFDLQTGERADEIRVAADTVNGCDFHPYLNLLAVATGAF